MSTTPSSPHPQGSRSAERRARLRLIPGSVEDGTRSDTNNQHALMLLLPGFLSRADCKGAGGPRVLPKGECAQASTDPEQIKRRMVAATAAAAAADLRRRTEMIEGVRCLRMHTYIHVCARGAATSTEERYYCMFLLSVQAYVDRRRGCSGSGWGPAAVHACSGSSVLGV